ncbi:MAG: hypothetical protein WA476_14100 [Acidobacteriaceae bacterium]
MLLLVLAVSSLIASMIVFPMFRAEGKSLRRWGKALFYTGSISNVISALTLLIFLGHAYRIAHGKMTFMDLDRIYPVLSMLGLGLIAAIFGIFGTRWSRPLLTIAGLVAAYSWYLAVLATSP